MEPNVIAPVQTVTSRPLLAAHAYFATTDLDEARILIGRQFRDHRLDHHRRVRPLRIVQNSAAIQEASLHFLDYGGAVRVRADELASFYLVIVPLVGRAELRCDGESVSCDERGLLVIPCDRPFALLWSEECRAVILRVERGAVERCLNASLGLRIRQPVRFTLCVRTEGGPGGLLRSLLLACAEQIDREPGMLGNHLLRHELSEILTRCLIGTVPHSYSLLSDPREHRISSRCVQNVVDHVDAHAAEPLPLERLVSVAGISGRALQSAFQRQIGMTPMEYVRRVRLERARKDLLEAIDSRVTVTDVALKWGFGHFGRFSAYYQQAFGELPSETLRR